MILTLPSVHLQNLREFIISNLTTTHILSVHPNRYQIILFLSTPISFSSMGNDQLCDLKDLCAYLLCWLLESSLIVNCSGCSWYPIQMLLTCKWTHSPSAGSIELKLTAITSTATLLWRTVLGEYFSSFSSLLNRMEGLLKQRAWLSFLSF